MKIKFMLLSAISCLWLFAAYAQEACLTNAETALSKKKYAEVISAADECISTFGKAALKMQQKLDSLKIDFPIGQVSDIDKKRIFDNGLLNDVATACCYKGKAAEALYMLDKKQNLKYKQIANDAYNLTLKYNKGRHWNPANGGFFWSPAESAGYQLPVE